MRQWFRRSCCGSCPRSQGSAIDRRSELPDSWLPPFYLHDLIGPGAAGCDDLNIGAFLLAHQRTGERRGDRDLAGLGVRFRLADDLPDRLLVGVLVDQRDSRAEFDGVARQLRNVDDIRARKLVLQVGNAALVVRLLLFRGMVLRVLRQIAVRTGVGDLLNDTRTLNLLAMLEFVFQNGIARSRHRYLVHRFSLSLDKKHRPLPGSL